MRVIGALLTEDQLNLEGKLEIWVSEATIWGDGGGSKKLLLLRLFLGGVQIFFQFFNAMKFGTLLGVPFDTGFSNDQNLPLPWILAEGLKSDMLQLNIGKISPFKIKMNLEIQKQWNH